MAATMFDGITNFLTQIKTEIRNIRFNDQRAAQTTAQDEIKFIAHHMKTNDGCETSNEWLDGVLTDRYAARFMLTQKHRYEFPIYPSIESQNQDEYIKRSDLAELLRQREFKQFIDNLKCSCPKH